MQIQEKSISTQKSVIQKMARPSIVALFLIALFSALTFDTQMRWIGNPFQNDVDQYYSYLIAQFIHHDFSFHFPHRYWLIESPIGDMIPKVTMGMAMFYFPFFMLGNGIALLFGYDSLGYSAPYAVCVHVGTLFYVLVGFWYMRKTLLMFFSEWVAAVTMLLIMFATNLFYYTFKEGEMAHSYLFFLFSLFFYHALKWHVTRHFKYLCYLSLIGGFVSLIRPTEVLIFLIPLLYQVNSKASFIAKLRELAVLKWKLIVPALLFILPLIPQMLFWKSFANQYLFFSYGSNEGFFFSDPKLWSVLFGWHKGWFVYTPLVFFMITGLVMMWFRWRDMAWPITAYLLLNIYLISSWWDWGFGGAFGMRALVQTYAFLSVPLAYFIQWCFSVTSVKARISLIASTIAVYLFLIALNLVQVFQSQQTILHWDSMTKKAYWYVFLKTKFSDNERAYLKTLLSKPDYNAMRKGERDEN